MKEIGIVGLGKMGRGIAMHLLEQGWRVAAFNRSPEAFNDVPGAIRADSLRGLRDALSPPRAVWLMLPQGSVIDEMIFGVEGFSSLLGGGDILIEGGNSFYKDSERRSLALAERGIKFLDVGVSGGPRGAREGASLMIGGDRTSYESLEGLFAALAVPGGFRYFGEAGAGHFVKMIHNGIEYGMMQAIAEGFNILKESSYRFRLQEVADLYNHGTVIESRLMGWLGKAFRENGEELKNISGSTGHTGEGEWTVKTAEELGAEAPVIKNSFEFRLRSANQPSFTGKILSALRNQFGGHAVHDDKK